jgi:molecular chaperone HtpG
MTATQTAPEAREYRTEVKQLLDILAHSLYTDREIFLRELLSNASDALNRVQFEMLTNHDVIDPDAKLAIWVRFNPDEKTITVSDTGVGMNHDELIENLGVIAHSGARAFLDNAKEGKASLEEIIGQFGVGFYSVFTVADEVTVTSRSYRAEEQAWTWRSTGDSRYELTPADKANRGTDVHIKLKTDAVEYASAWRLEQIIKKHSDYVSFPIYVIDETAETADEDELQPVNRQTALWRQTPSKVDPEEYDEFYQQLTLDFEKPLLHVHMVADMPVNLRALLYVPAKREGSLLNPRVDHGLRLYSRKVLIQERNKDLLPEYLRFVDGVVDSEDLPLNVSREMVQTNPVIRQLHKALTGRILKELKNLADKDPERYSQFWREFGVFLKEGIAVDFTNKDALVDLLRFHSTEAAGEEEWTSLPEYVERMGEDGAQATLTGSRSLNWREDHWAMDPALIDAGLQLARVWGVERLHQLTLPTSIREFNLIRPGLLEAGARVSCILRGETIGQAGTRSDLWFVDEESGETVAEIQGLEMYVSSEQPISKGTTADAL